MNIKSCTHAIKENKLKFKFFKTAMMMFVIASTNSAMAASVDYTFSGSNIPQSGEPAGTINGTFTLDDGAFDDGTQTGTNWSFTVDQDGYSDTFASTDAGIQLEQFEVSTNGDGVVTSLIFNDEYFPFDGRFLQIRWDSLYENSLDSRNSGLDNKASYGLLDDSASTIFLDNVAVSQVPVPAAAWLFGSALIGLAGIKRKRA
ncbi:MAG: VPLPA-CTERM sorting domain-containing protein [Halioglobus sp.]